MSYSIDIVNTIVSGMCDHKYKTRGSQEPVSFTWL